MIKEVNELKCPWLIMEAYRAITKFGAEIIEVDECGPDSITYYSQFSDSHVVINQSMCDDHDHNNDTELFVKNSTIKKMLK